MKWWVTCCSSAVWQHLGSRYDASNSTHWWFSSQCCLLFLAHSRVVSDSDRPLHKLQTHTWSSDCSNWAVFSRFFYHSRLSFTRLAQWEPKGFCLSIGRLHFIFVLLYLLGVSVSLLYFYYWIGIWHNILGNIYFVIFLHLNFILSFMYELYIWIENIIYQSHWWQRGSLFPFDTITDINEKGI